MYNIRYSIKEAFYVLHSILDQCDHQTEIEESRPINLSLYHDIPCFLKININKFQFPISISFAYDSDNTLSKTLYKRGGSSNRMGYSLQSNLAEITVYSSYTDLLPSERHHQFSYKKPKNILLNQTKDDYYYLTLLPIKDMRVVVMA